MSNFINFSNYLSTQIDFLLWLQNIRNHYSSLNQFFLFLTTFGEFLIPASVCGIVYWCFDAILGIYLFSLFSINLLINQLAKMIACIYRPWILNNNITPPQEALKLARGYSFPSGHSSIATSCYGGLAYILKHKIFSTLLLMLILCVMFSRLWLGVHTPQDVIVGFLISALLVFAIKPIIQWCEEKHNRYLYLLAILDALATLALSFICYKHYPMDYINEKLIVNPSSSIYASVTCYGYALGLLNGALLCRRFFPFNTEISIKNKILRGIFGLIMLQIIFFLTSKYIFSLHQDYKVAFTVIFLFGLITTGIYPLIFTTIEKFIKHRQ